MARHFSEASMVNFMSGSANPYAAVPQHSVLEEDEQLLPSTMKADGMRGLWADMKQNRRAYILTAVSSFGGMLFGWDTV